MPASKNTTAPKKPRPVSAKSAASKADKPELKPLDEHLAELLSPALNRNRPKPIEAAPQPAKGAKAKGARPKGGFGEAPQAGYAIADAAEVDPRLAQALGLAAPEDGPAPAGVEDTASLATEGVSATMAALE
ncbi:MAG: excinuclease ABC subunit B, partial [Methylobacterium sp.]